MWRRRLLVLLVLSRGLMYCMMFREQIWSPCSQLREFSLISFLKVFRNAANLSVDQCRKSGLKRGSVTHYQSWFVIPIGAKVDFRHRNADFTTNLVEISQNGMSRWVMGLRSVWYTFSPSWYMFPDISYAHFGQECPNGFLSFVLNWLLNGVRSDGLCMGVVDPISSVK